MTDSDRSPFGAVGAVLHGAVLGFIFQRYLQGRRVQIAAAPLLFWAWFLTLIPSMLVTLALWAGVRYHGALWLLPIGTVVSYLAWRFVTAGVIAPELVTIEDDVELATEAEFVPAPADDTDLDWSPQPTAPERWAETRPVRHAEVTESGLLIRDRRTVDPEEL